MKYSEGQLRVIIDTIPTQAWSCSSDGSAEFCNRRWLDYTGLSVEEALGWSWKVAIHPDDLSRMLEIFQEALNSGHPWEVEARLRRFDGEFRWFLFRASPLRDESGRVVKWYGTNTDIDKRKKAEEKLQRSETDLLEAQRLSHTGSWKHNLLSGEVTVSPEVFRIRGIQHDDDASRAGFFFDRIHPEDRRAVKQVYERAQIQKVDYEADYRIVLPDGTIKHLHTIGHPVLNELGDLIEFVGTAMDVTEQRQASAKLEQAFQEIKHLKDRLHDENLALREHIDQALMFEEIVGSSPALQTVLSNIVKVAPTDSTVLITGETGTGKELIARAIHKHSRRSGHAFISVNCASIPSSLIASELFGHEKGAFTGAVQQRRGRFELAHSGTIFLDEIGELPSETQIALLRVLQERQIERVGGNRVIPVDVRVIAATNRDLSSAIATTTFRTDLFYRLNVFPIQVPALRKRKEDIPILVEYFVERFADKMGKQIGKIDKKTLELFQTYHWPGNIRELQNIIERAVILCSGDTFWIDEAWLSTQELPQTASSGPLPATLHNQEKDIIEAALAETKGKVAGSNGAAAKLGIPPSTLESKIKQLKITKRKFTIPG